jgi:hypothetical protein
MVLKPSGKWVRTGPPYRSKKNAQSWLPFVRGANRGGSVKLRQCTVRFTPQGEPTEVSVKRLDQEFNCTLTKERPDGRKQQN